MMMMMCWIFWMPARLLAPWVAGAVGLACPVWLAAAWVSAAACVAAARVACAGRVARAPAVGAGVSLAASVGAAVGAAVPVALGGVGAVVGLAPGWRPLQASKAIMTQAAMMNCLNLDTPHLQTSQPRRIGPGKKRHHYMTSRARFNWTTRTRHSPGTIRETPNRPRARRRWRPLRPGPRSCRGRHPPAAAPAARAQRTRRSRKRWRVGRG